MVILKAMGVVRCSARSCNGYFWKSEAGSLDFASYLHTSVNSMHLVFKT